MAEAEAAVVAVADPLPLVFEVDLAEAVPEVETKVAAVAVEEAGEAAEVTVVEVTGTRVVMEVATVVAAVTKAGETMAPGRAKTKAVAVYGIALEVVVAITVGVAAVVVVAGATITSAVVTNKVMVVVL